jgi:uncharacterized RDD family membrane protein YckC
MARDDFVEFSGLLKGGHATQRRCLYGMSGPATARVEWEPAAFGDRLCADFVDGAIALAIALPVYFFIDRQLLGLETGLLDAGSDYGLSDLVLWFCFLFNMTYLVGKRGQSWGRQFWGLKVVERAGEPIGFVRALFSKYFRDDCIGDSSVFGFSLGDMGSE